mmetsp:Transcript_22493/g.73417  ORF Transcript_22493/g.73417 Transcript_22493/m.73417 type:complete len:762 (-) Transcript_22493:447-2732(-)
MMVDGRLPQRVARVAEAVVRRLLVLEQVDAVGVAAQGAGLRGGGGRAFHGHPAGADAVAVGVGERPLLAREALVRSGGGLAVLRHVAAGRAGRVAGAGRLVLVGGGPVGVGPEHARVGVARARRVLGVAAGRLARVALAGPAAVAGVLSVWVVVARAPDGAVDALVRRLERLVDEEGVRGAGGLLVEAAPGRVVVAEPAVDEALAVDGAEAPVLAVDGVVAPGGPAERDDDGAVRVAIGARVGELEREPLAGHEPAASAEVRVPPDGLALRRARQNRVAKVPVPREDAEGQRVARGLGRGRDRRLEEAHGELAPRVAPRRRAVVLAGRDVDAHLPDDAPEPVLALGDAVVAGLGHGPGHGEVAAPGLVAREEEPRRLADLRDVRLAVGALRLDEEVDVEPLLGEDDVEGAGAAGHAEVGQAQVDAVAVGRGRVLALLARRRRRRRRRRERRRRRRQVRGVARRDAEVRRGEVRLEAARLFEHEPERRRRRLGLVVVERLEAPRARVAGGRRVAEPPRAPGEVVVPLRDLPRDDAAVDGLRVRALDVEFVRRDALDVVRQEALVVVALVQRVDDAEVVEPRRLARGVARVVDVRVGDAADDAVGQLRRRLLEVVVRGEPRVRRRARRGRGHRRRARGQEVVVVEQDLAPLRLPAVSGVAVLQEHAVLEVRRHRVDVDALLEFVVLEVGLPAAAAGRHVRQLHVRRLAAAALACAGHVVDRALAVVGILGAVAPRAVAVAADVEDDRRGRDDALQDLRGDECV